jgi:hypothetical protein
LKTALSQEDAMPDAKDNAKMTGDTHPPEVESELPLQEDEADSPGISGTRRDRGKATERGQESRPGRGIKKAGVLKDKDDKSSDEGSTTKSGEGSGESRG